MIQIDIDSTLASLGSLPANQLDGLHVTAQAKLAELELEMLKRTPKAGVSKGSFNGQGLMRFLKLATKEQAKEVQVIATFIASRMKSAGRC